MNLPCEGCQKLYDGWLLYTRPADRWIQGPKNPERSAEIRSMQIRATRDLKRQQCDAVVESCRARGCLEDKRAA